MLLLHISGLGVFYELVARALHDLHNIHHANPLHFCSCTWHRLPYGQIHYCWLHSDGQDKNQRRGYHLIYALVKTNNEDKRYIPQLSSTGIQVLVSTQLFSIQLSVGSMGTSMRWLPSTTSRPPFDMSDVSTAIKIVR